MPPENKQQILERRKEIESELEELLVATASDFSLEDVKKAIYEEAETDDMQDIIMMFDDGNTENLSNVLETVSDAWNYFPHKILGGISPAEKLLERQEEQKL